jgi:hypothetical protein
MKTTPVLLHEPIAPGQSANSFRGYEQAFKDAQDQRKRDAEVEITKRGQAQVRAMIAGEITDAAWDELVGKAQTAAERGEKQYMLLRFPSGLCTDDSRAINNPPDSTWPQTLQGEAAEIYERWHSALRPHGFDLSAQVLEFPGGKPGDVGLFLRWGG